MLCSIISYTTPITADSCRFQYCVKQHDKHLSHVGSFIFFTGGAVFAKELFILDLSWSVPAHICTETEARRTWNPLKCAYYIGWKVVMFDTCCSFCGRSLCTVILLHKKAMTRKSKNETKIFVPCLLYERQWSGSLLQPLNNSVFYFVGHFIIFLSVLRI